MSMNSKSRRTAVFCVVFAMLALAACRKGESVSGDAATATIAPAEPQPAPTGTDAMTQTVDIEDSRSDAEGGSLAPTAGASDATMAPTGTATPPPTQTTTR